MIMRNTVVTTLCSELGADRVSLIYPFNSSGKNFTRKRYFFIGVANAGFLFLFFFLSLFFFPKPRNCTLYDANSSQRNLYLCIHRGFAFQRRYLNQDDATLPHLCCLWPKNQNLSRKFISFQRELIVESGSRFFSSFKGHLVHTHGRSLSTRCVCMCRHVSRPILCSAN